MNRSRVPCVGAIVVHASGRLLLVQRAQDPGRGLWSIPGGRVEAGESAQDAVVREVAEETGLQVRVAGRAGVVERPAPDGSTYVIEDFHAVHPDESGVPAVRAGDDAAAAGWFSDGDLETLPCVAGLLEALREWRVLPLSSSSATPPGSPARRPAR